MKKFVKRYENFNRWNSEEGIKDIERVSALGYTLKEISDYIGISTNSFREWRYKSKEMERAAFCRGRKDIEYKLIEQGWTKYRKLQFFKGGQEVFYCGGCINFVAREDKLDNAYCRDCNREKVGKYAKENTVRAMIRGRERLSKIKNSIVIFDEKDWHDTLIHFNNECAYCGTRDYKLEKEHVIPISKNGWTVRSNIVPSCRACNMNKYTHYFEDWYPNYKHYSPIRQNKINKWIGAKESAQQLTLL